MEDKRDIENKIEELGKLFDEYIKKMSELKNEQDALVDEYITRLSEKKKEIMKREISE